METILDELRALLPPGVYFEQENEFEQILSVFALEFQKIKSDAEAVFKEFNPLCADKIFLEDWKRVFQLDQVGQSLKDEVVRRINYEGAQNRESYNRIIRSCGFEKFDIDLCESANVAQIDCNSILYDSGWMNHFIINIEDLPIKYLDCGSYCTEFFYEDLDANLIRALNRFQLAHTRGHIQERRKNETNKR